MIHARVGHHDLARAAYQEGLRRAGAMPFPYGRARLLHAYGLLDRQQQDEARAHAKFAQALAILERLGADKDADRLRRAIAHTPPDLHLSSGRPPLTVRGSLPMPCRAFCPGHLSAFVRVHAPPG